MNWILTSVRLPGNDELQYFFWRHPEWWSRGLCYVAWAVMLVHGWQHGGHEVHQAMTFAQETAYWMLMIAAMMLPLVFHRLWVTAAGSLWSRRHRAIAGFLAGYFAPWLVMGVMAAGLRTMAWTHTYLAAALGFMAAALWQLTPMHRRAMAACHVTQPLAPGGWRADRDCVRFGGVIGTACAGSCGPLMLACAFTGHSLVAMAGGMAVGTLARRSTQARTLLATLALSAYFAVLTIIG